MRPRSRNRSRSVTVTVTVTVTVVITTLPSLCAPRAHVIWTRHRRPPDWTATIRSIFRDSGFREVDFADPQEHVFFVGAQQFERPPDPFVAGASMFVVSGDGAGLA